MDADAFSRSLDLVVQRVGHPHDQVYTRLFAAAPELQALFVLDTSGAVRQEMLRLCFDALLDLCGEGHYARGLFSTEVLNHRQVGVTPQQFQSLFTTVRDVVRDVHGTDWTPATDAAWTEVLARVDRLMQAIDTPH